jgi:hypothetical protein
MAFQMATQRYITVPTLKFVGNKLGLGKTPPNPTAGCPGKNGYCFVAGTLVLMGGPEEETLLVSAVPLGQPEWWSGRGVALILVTWAVGELFLERKRKTDQEDEERGKGVGLGFS